MLKVWDPDLIGASCLVCRRCCGVLEARARRRRDGHDQDRCGAFCGHHEAGAHWAAPSTSPLKHVCMAVECLRQCFANAHREVHGLRRIKPAKFKPSGLHLTQACPQEKRTPPRQARLLSTLGTGMMRVSRPARRVATSQACPRPAPLPWRARRSLAVSATCSQQNMRAPDAVSRAAEHFPYAHLRLWVHDLWPWCYCAKALLDTSAVWSEGQKIAEGNTHQHQVALQGRSAYQGCLLA